jgi:hypothetical protein
MSKSIKINIGLNNSTTDFFGQLAELDNVIFNGEYWQSTLKIMTWKERHEPTTVAEGYTKLSIPVLKNAFEYLCAILTQDCIPFIYEGKGYLIYNKSYKGTKEKFSLKYFATL